MKFSMYNFITTQRTPVPPVVHEDLSGKTVVVIGANSGIGFEATKHFAKMNAGRLILGCRSQQKGEAALEKLKEETGCDHAELWMIDLAEFSSVVAFADRFEKDGGMLDILVENAGVIPLPPFDQQTVDGWEPTFQVNHLSTSLLAFLLLPRILDTAKEHDTIPRIVIVTSEFHLKGGFDEELVDSPNPLKALGSAEYFRKKGGLDARYIDTKLLNVLFSRGLSDRLYNQQLIVDSVNPGYCYSNMRATFTGLRAWADYVMEKLLAWTAEQGSRQLVWAAIGGKEDLGSLRGAYISLARVAEPSDYVISAEGLHAQNRLWDDLVKELAKIEPRVQNIVDKYLSSLRLPVA